MKSLISLVLIGKCVAFSPLQQALQAPKHASDSWNKPLHNLQDSLKSLTQDARALWDEVSLMYPKAMDETSFFSLPKRHSRRPNSHWDYTTRGADIQSLWVEDEDGERKRKVDGKLEAFDLRTKKVDPTSLGVDPGVQQYSGYLDDNENDKHLFYCEKYWRYDISSSLLTMFIQGSSSLEMIHRMTQLFSGSMGDPGAHR